MKEVEKLEKKLFAAEPVLIRNVKITLFNNYNFSGVYTIHKDGKLLKIGKTSGKPSASRKEKLLADRIWGLTRAGSILREEMKWTKKQAEECEICCVQVDDDLLRGRLEYYLIAKYYPCVNKRELKR